jgi:ribosome-associated toxin RatA of RatAB toxin-antitoxin module
MAVIQRSARVPHSALQMLTLVNDIEAYPEFLHWCHAARIEKQEGHIVEAALDIGISGIYKTIRTENTTEAPDGGDAQIRIELLEGPFRKMHGLWTFRDVVDSAGSDVDLCLEYEVHRTPIGMILRPLFEEIANSQLHAFTKRAEVIYGSRAG